MSTQYIPELPPLLVGRQPGTSEADLGITSDIFDQEWNEFLARRKALYDNMVGRLGLAQGIAAATGITPEEALPAAHIEMDSVWDDKRQGWLDRARAGLDRYRQLNPTGLLNILSMGEKRSGQSDWNDLIGWARAHGIESPEKLPPDLLLEMLEERRSAVKGRDPHGDLPASLGEWGDLVARRLRGEPSTGLGNRALSEQFDASALGTLGGLVDMIQNIPFIGDVLAKNRAVQAADQSINMALEGLRADLPEERMQAFNVSAGVGGFVGYTYMGLQGYRVATKVIPIPFRVNGKQIDTLGRSAMRGALTAWMLEGGGDDPVFPAEETWRAIGEGDWKRAIEVLETRSGKIAAGSALGVFFDYALPRLVSRLRNSFGSRLANEQVARGTRQRLNEGIQEADYYMTEPGGLPSPPRALPPGQQAIESGPNIIVTPRPQGPSGAPFAPPAPGSAPMLPPGQQAALGLTQQLEGLGVQMAPSGWHILYHGTTGPLDSPYAGMHLGSQLAARQRTGDVATDLASQGFSTPRGQIYPIAIDPTARILGTPDQPAFGDINPDVGVFESPADEAALQRAQQEGYQGAYYRNSIEDPGSSSLYLLDPSIARLYSPEPAPLLTQSLDEQTRLATRMAEIDEQTGLGNLRAFQRVLDAAEADPNTVVVAFGIENFEAVLDHFGMDVATDLLYGFTMAFQQAADELRNTYVAFRAGERDFAVLVPREAAATWRNRVEELSVHPLLNDADEPFEVSLTGALGETHYQANDRLTSYMGGRRPNIQGFTPDEAATEAIALTRQNQVLESPYLDEVMDQPVFDVVDVVQAERSANAAGVHIIREVGDAGSVIRRMAEADMSLPLTGVVAHRDNPLRTAAVERVGTSYRTVFRTADEVVDIVETNNPSQVLSTLREEGFPVRTRRVMPQHMRVVERLSYGFVKHDLMISDGRPITNTMVEEYRATGTFAGARVRQYGGIEGNVEMVILDDNPSIVVPIGGGRRIDLYPGDYYMVGVGNFSIPTSLDQFYENFKSDALDQLAMDALDDIDISGVSPQVQPIWLSEGVLGQMPRLLDEHLDRKGIEDATSRAAYRAGVNHLVNQELQALAPDADQAMLNRALDILEGHVVQTAPARRRRRSEALQTQTITLGEARQQTQNAATLAQRPPGHVTRGRRRAAVPIPGDQFSTPRPSLPAVQELAETKGFDYIPVAPRPYTYGATFRITPNPNPGAAWDLYQADIQVEMHNIATGDYAGYLAATLREDGTFYVHNTDAHAAGYAQGRTGGPNALGHRQMRDIGRQIVLAVRAEGLMINEIRGYRVSGARAASRRRRGTYATLQAGTDTDMVVSADQMVRGVRSGGTLKHKFSELEVPVDSDEAALAFLTEFAGDVPDITPITGYPLDALPITPGMDNPGHSLPPVWEEGFDQYMDSYMGMTDSLERYVDEVTESMYEELPPGLQPDPWSGGFVGGGDPPLPPTVRPSYPAGQPGSPGGGSPSTEVRSQTLGGQFRLLRKNNPTAVADIIRRQESAWLRLMEPWRHRMLAMETQMQEAGLSLARPWEQTTRMTTAIDKSHNEANPWHQEWTGITSQFRRKYRRDGTVVRIEEIPNWNDKLRAMQEAGYTVKEMEAQRQIRPFFDRMHGEAGLTHYIFDYIPHLRQRQGMVGIEDPYSGSEAVLPRELQFFAEHVRAGNVDMRQLDIGTLGALWIRGWQFKKHVGPIWEETYKTWSEAGIPTPIKNVILDWMHLARVGHDPKQEIAVGGARQVLNNFGIPVTSGEIAGLWNGLLTNTYRSMLGGRPDVVFRDSIQPLLTWARVGGNIEDMAAIYVDYIRNPQLRGEMIERAERMGTVVRGMTQTAYAEAFTQPVQTNEGFPLFSSAMQARREKIATVGDFLHDLVPRRFRGGIQGTYADPMLMYTKTGELNRIISGEYGYRTARKPLDKYFAGEIDYTTLLGDSRARVYPMPIQRRFRELVNAGDKEGAASLLANEAANLQLRYGSREGPTGTRNIPGRLAMMFGTFSQQYLAYMREAASHGTMADRAGFGARYAAIAAVLGGLSAATGWKFSKWMWHNSLTFVGGPLVEFAATAMHALGGFSAKAQGMDVQPHEVRAMEDMEPENVAGGFLESVFPYGGTVKTMHRFGSTIGPGNPHQVERSLELLLTGQQRWDNIYDRNYRSEIQPHTPDFSQPMYWQPYQGTGGFPQPPGGAQAQPVAPMSYSIPPRFPGDTLTTEGVGVMQEALRSTPPGEWQSRMQGAGYNDAIVQQVIKAGAGAVQ